MQTLNIHGTVVNNPANMHQNLWLEGVVNEQPITVYTRNDEGEDLREAYEATFVRTVSDNSVVIRTIAEGERTIVLDDTLNFDVEEEDNSLFVVEEVFED